MYYIIYIQVNKSENNKAKNKHITTFHRDKNYFKKMLSRRLASVNKIVGIIEMFHWFDTLGSVNRMAILFQQL